MAPCPSLSFPATPSLGSASTHHPGDVLVPTSFPSRHFCSALCRAHFLSMLSFLCRHAPALCPKVEMELPHYELIGDCLA